VARSRELTARSVF